MSIKGNTSATDNRELRRLRSLVAEKDCENMLQTLDAQFGAELAFACSFSVEDMVILDMLAKIRPKCTVFYIDTGLFFAETYQTMARAKERYELEFKAIRPRISPAEQAKKYGEQLWERDPDLCCALRKVQPLERELDNYRGWITGIRREQAPSRAHMQKAEWDERFGLFKFNPLVDWSWGGVWRYVKENDVPYNPLYEQGYPSIGCRPCTRPVAPGEHPRAGRWAERGKTECGLHKAD